MKLVWIATRRNSDSQGIFHSKPICHSLKYALRAVLEDAEALDYRACSLCMRDEPA